jgi:hypothetical protein
MADAQYVIDIAASMPDGDATASELDALTANLMGAGKGADHFQAAIAQVSNALKAAQQASASANEALAAGTAEYRSLERAALQASKAAEKAALQNEGVVPDDLADRVRSTHHELEQFTVRLADLETGAKGAAQAEEELARQLGNVKRLGSHVDKTLAQQNEQLGKLQGSLGAVGGPLGSLGQQIVGPVKGFTELASSIGTARAAMILGAAAAVAIAAAIAALTVALVAGTIAIAAWAVGLADSNRSAGLAQEAFEAMHPDLAALSGDFKALADETGLGADALRGIAKGLKDAGESSDAMSDSLRTAAIAERALGSGGAAAYTQLVKAAADATAEAEKVAEKTGRVPAELAKKVADATAAVDDFAMTAQTKLGGVVARQMMGLDAQGERFKKNINELFGGLNIDPVLEGLQRLVALFDANTEAGQTIKFLFESVFQPLIDQADEAAIAVERFALGFLIGLTKLYISLKPVVRAIEDFFGFEDDSLLSLMGDVKNIGEVVAYGMAALAGAFGLVIAALLAVPATIALAVAAFTAFWQMVGEAGAKAALGIRDAITGALDWVRSIDLMQIGRDILQGMANGISASAGVVRDAVSNAVNGAIRSAKEALGIASPSKVFANFGELTGEGYTEGVEDSSGDAQAALTALVQPPEIPATFSAREEIPARGTPMPAAPAEGGSGGASVNLAGAVFNFYGVANAESATQSFEEVLTRILEGDATKLGTEAPA